jgi:hypothetical protein
MTKGGQIEFVKLIRIGTNANCNVSPWSYANRNLFFIFYFHILAEKTSAYLRQEWLLFDQKVVLICVKSGANNCAFHGTSTATPISCE